VVLPHPETPIIKITIENSIPPSTTSTHYPAAMGPEWFLSPFFKIYAIMKNMYSENRKEKP